MEILLYVLITEPVLIFYLFKQEKQKHVSNKYLCMNIYDIFILKIQNEEQCKCSFSDCIKNVLMQLNVTQAKNNYWYVNNTCESQNHLAQ